MSAAVLVLAPVRPGACAALQAVLRALPDGAASPFARLGGTHVARFTVVPGLGLLLAADVDPPPAEWLDRIRTRMGAEAEQVWSHCVAWPGTTDPVAYARWIADRRVAPGFTVAPYPRATVEEVRAALDLRRTLGRVAADVARADPAALKGRLDEVLR